VVVAEVDVDVSVGVMVTSTYDVEVRGGDVSRSVTVDGAGGAPVTVTVAG
jgi:hypothetical protein